MVDIRDNQCPFDGHQLDEIDRDKRTCPRCEANFAFFGIKPDGQDYWIQVAAFRGIGQQNVGKRERVPVAA